jgi:molybdate transport system permease protein
VIAATVVSFPLMYRTVRGALEAFDLDLVNAARTLGMPEWQIFLKVILPNIKSSILAGTVLSFARAMGEFGATIMVAGNIPGRTQTMSTAVYTAVQSGNREAALLWSLLICLISFAVVYLLNRQQAGGATHLTGGGGRGFAG